MTGLPAASWYPDPSQPGLLRWWDGSSWSTHVMDAPDATPAAAAAPATPVYEQAVPAPRAFGVAEPASVIAEPAFVAAEPAFVAAEPAFVPAEAAVVATAPESPALPTPLLP